MSADADWTMHSDPSRSAHRKARTARADFARDARHGPRVWPAGMGAVGQASRWVARGARGRA